MNPAGDEQLATLLAALLADPTTIELVVTAAAGEVVSRLRLIDHVATLLPRHYQEHLAVWAVTGLLVPALRVLLPTLYAGDPSDP